jgi:hypothetical protein
MEAEVRRKFNWLYIFQQGYFLIGIPLNLYTFAVTGYYLMVKNIPALYSIFPDFWIFLVVGIALGVPFTLALGIVYVKSELYKGQTKVNPYSYVITPNLIPLYEAVAAMVEREGDAATAERLRRVVGESII